MKSDDLPLIVAHLLGGTTGLNLNQSMGDDEIEVLVTAAVRVAKEIQRQVGQLEAARLEAMASPSKQ